MARFQSDSFQIKTTDLNGGTAVAIGGVTSTTVRTNTQTISDESGDIYDETMSILSQIIDAEQTHKCLDQILTYIGLGGYCISSDGSHPGLTMFGRILGDCKSPPGSTDNVSYTFPLGLACIGRIDARRGADATVTLMVKPLTDGTNAPMAFANSSVTLPARSALVKNLFTIGACKIGAVVLNDFSGLSLEFGITTSAMTPQQGSIWPDSVGIRKIQPTATFTGFDPRILDNSSGIPLLGKQATHANTLIQFKKRLGYSSFVANATTQHIALTMNGMAYVTDVFTGSGNGEATNAIVVKGVHDSTNVPILANVAIAYNPSP